MSIKRVVTLALMVFFLLSSFSCINSRTVVAASSSQAVLTSPEDFRTNDAYWKFGLYFNPADSRLNVPKRYGGGYTINIGHPMGGVLLGLFGIVIGASIYFKYRKK